MENFRAYKDAYNGAPLTPMSNSQSCVGVDDQLEQNDFCQSHSFDGQNLEQPHQPTPQVLLQQAVLICNTAGQMRPLLHERVTDAEYTPKSYIDGEDDFRLKMQAYLTLCDQQLDPAAIADFPFDSQTQQVLVQQLVAAMIYVGDDCEDADSKKSVNRIHKLSPLELNLMAWNVLFDTRDCQMGQTGMPRWGKDWTMQNCQTFHERFELVKAALHCHKASVASLFDYTFAKRLSLNPAAETGKIRGNKIVNNSRKQDLAIAKQEKSKREPQAGSRRSKKQAVRNNTAVAAQVQAAQLQRGQGILTPAQQTWFSAPSGPHVQGGVEIPISGESSTVATAGPQPEEGELGGLPLMGENKMLPGDNWSLQDGELDILPPLEEAWMNQMLDDDWVKRNSYTLP